MAVTKKNHRLLAIVALILTGFCLLSACTNTADVQGGLYVPEVTAPPQTNYKTATVERGDYLVTAHGSAERIFTNEKTLFWEDGNVQVESILVKEKQEVKKGDVLMTFTAVIDQIDLKSRRMERDRLRQEFADGKASRKAAIEQLEKDALQMNPYDRAIAEQTLEKMRASYDTYVFQTGNALQEKEAYIAKLENPVTELIAPFDGVIDSVAKYSPETPVYQGTKLITMHATDEYIIKLNGALPFNTPVTITCTTNSAVKIFLGHVVTSSGSVLVRLDEEVAPSDLNGAIRYSADTQVIKDVLIAPRSAIRQENGVSYVYVLENGAEQKRYVSVQHYTGTDVVWILDGLSEGQVLVVD